MASEQVNTSDEEFSRAAAFLDYEAHQEGGNDKENYEFESENTDDRNFIDDGTPEKPKRKRKIKRKACVIISSSEAESSCSSKSRRSTLQESNSPSTSSSLSGSSRSPRINYKDSLNCGPIISLIHRTKNILAAWEKQNSEIENVKLKRKEAHALQQLLLSSMKLCICRYNQGLLMDEKLEEASKENWLLRQESQTMKDKLKKLKDQNSLLQSTIALYKTMIPKEDHI